MILFVQMEALPNGTGYEGEITAAAATQMPILECYCLYRPCKPLLVAKSKTQGERAAYFYCYFDFTLHQIMLSSYILSGALHNIS
jgi:hypothetical protein